MANTFNSLYDFIDRAQRNRKYLPNTATNFRTPLRLVEAELTDEEKASIQLVKERLDKIFHAIYSKNEALSAASLEVYKRRIRNLISDFEKYGTDPTKMANWNRETIVRKITKEKKPSSAEVSIVSSEDNTPAPAEMLPQFGKDMVKFELPFKDGTKAVIFTPQPLDSQKLRQIKGYITYLETSLVEEETQK